MAALVTRRDDAIQKLLTIADDATSDTARARIISSHMEWNAGDIMALTVAADVAIDYLNSRAAGKDPAAIAHILVAKAIGVLKETVGGGSNLRVDSHGLHRLAQADGQRIALRGLVRVLPRDLQEVVGWY